MGFVPTEEERKAARMYEPYIEGYNKLSKQLSEIKELINKTPNDQELGREIRKKISECTK